MTQLTLVHARLQEERRAVSQQAAHFQRQAALRQMVGISKGYVYGQVKGAIDEWKRSALISTLDAEKAHELARLRKALEAQAADTSRGAGLRMLKQAMARLVRGELGLRLEVWRQEVSKHRMRQQERGTGLKAMQQIMVRLVKGEVAMRVVMWRTSTREASHADALSLLQLQWETKMAAQADAAANATLHTAINQIRQIWARSLKGELGLRVVVWRTAMAEERRLEEGARVRRGFEAQASDAIKAAGLQMMKQIKVRLTRAEQYAIVSLWRQGTEEAQHALEVARVQRELELRHSEHAKGQGLKLMAQIMTRAMKGEAGMRLFIWRTATLDTKQLDALSSLQRTLEAKANDASRGAGIRQLKQVMIRIGKGEASMRLEVWRSEVKMAAYARHKEIAALLKAQMEAQGRGAGLRMLRQIMARQVKGEAGMRLEIWRTSLRMQVAARHQALEAAEKSGIRAQLRNGSLQLLRCVVGRMLRGAAQQFITQWRAKMSAEAHLQALSRMHRVMEARCHVTRGCAIRMLAQTVGRRQRGETAASLETWRSALKLATYERHVQMQQELQAQLARHSQSGLAALSPQKLPTGKRK